MFDADFRDRTAKLYMPEMGTETVAPLLYWLVRMVRPQRVLEVGMGYTTPWLARALADNAEAWRQERDLLDSPAGEQRFPKSHATYFEQPYAPKLVCIDRMLDTSSSAPQAWQVLEDLGLTGVCEVIEGDLKGSSPRVEEALGLVDFAWIDTWDTLAFVREYWRHIDPSGGILAVHYLMTYPEGRAVQHYLRSLAGPDGGLETLNLLEPHKNAQNSLTLLRRIRDFEDVVDLRPQGAAADPRGVLDPAIRGADRRPHAAPSEEREQRIQPERA
jgi:predicted O-methyltransferase YrrM